MGLLRLVLALSVVVAHTGPWFGLRLFGNGVMAVESFYILSGFYMALVLSQRYRNQTRTFYFNRFLRLYPTYVIMGLFFMVPALLYLLLTGRGLGALATWREVSFSLPAVIALFSNLTMLGADTLLLVSELDPTHKLVGKLLVIAPIWSISVELVFYAGIPFVMRRPVSVRVLIFAVVLLIRWGIYHQGGGWTPWLYYFAPSSWALFMGGVLAHDLHQSLQQQLWFQRFHRPIGYLLSGLLLAGILAYWRIPLLHFQDWRYYLGFSVALPFIFAALGNQRFDRALADYSYPIYLGHWVILSLYAPLRHFVSDHNKVHVVLIGSIALAYLALRLDRLVQDRFKRKPKPIPVSTAA